jgi:hypothetical protein
MVAWCPWSITILQNIGVDVRIEVVSVIPEATGDAYEFRTPLVQVNRVANFD